MEINSFYRPKTAELFFSTN